MWREMVQATFKKRRGRLIGSVQLDVISKMFDRAQHRRFALAARWSGYLPWLLRATITAYRRLRTVVLPEGFAGDPILPTVGVIPDSATAIFEVAALLVETLEAFFDRWSSLVPPGGWPITALLVDPG